MSVAAIIVAAGRGARAGGGLPKQWRSLGTQSVAAHTLNAFAVHTRIDRIVLVLHPDDMDTDFWPRHPMCDVVVGGETRTQSVRAGLEALEGAVDLVLIHDVARPLVEAALIDRVIDALDAHEGAAPALAVTDALWRGGNSTVQGTVDRSDLYRAQTPQGFVLERILAAHRSFDGDAADDVEIARSQGIDVAIVPGDENNLKITMPADFERAAHLLKQKGPKAMDIRVGNGFDVHRFGPGDHVMLCGVAVPHGRGLQGHSDADVGLHTIADAIYGRQPYR